MCVSSLLTIIHPYSHNHNIRYRSFVFITVATLVSTRKAMPVATVPQKPRIPSTIHPTHCPLRIRMDITTILLILCNQFSHSRSKTYRKRYRNRNMYIYIYIERERTIYYIYSSGSQSLRLQSLYSAPGGGSSNPSVVVYTSLPILAGAPLFNQHNANPPNFPSANH